MGNPEPSLAAPLGVGGVHHRRWTENGAILANGPVRRVVVKTPAGQSFSVKKCVVPVDTMGTAQAQKRLNARGCLPATATGHGSLRIADQYAASHTVAAVRRVHMVWMEEVVAPVSDPGE